MHGLGRWISGSESRARAAVTPYENDIIKAFSIYTDNVMGAVIAACNLAELCVV
jgi:hypothetical protein